MPDLSLELHANETAQCQLIAGVDEAGRGALAGPVVAAAVILPWQKLELMEQLKGVDDSKKVPAPTREQLADRILDVVVSWGIGVVHADIIDNIGILPATRRAMRIALAQLSPGPEFLLIDGRIRLHQINTPQQSIIRGDCHSLSIAAASILAKVGRDRLMQELDLEYPAYGFGRHKGYGTRKHLTALARLGPTPIHRLSFAPMRHSLL